MSFKVIIAGGREFNDYDYLKRRCSVILRHKKDIIVVSGQAKGADTLGERLAYELGYSVKVFPADWDTHGRSAGYIRNSQMADYADALIAFWDGKSKGTGHMIDLAKSKGLQVRVVYYET